MKVKYKLRCRKKIDNYCGLPARLLREIIKKLEFKSLKK